MVVPSNQGMKLTPGRHYHTHPYTCSLPSLVRQRIVAALPGAAYP